MTDEKYLSMEGLISSDGRPFWNQSYYFMAYDAAAKTGCFIRFGFEESENKSNSWVLFFRDGKPLFQRLNASLPYTGNRIIDGVQLAETKITSLEPLTSARVEVSDPHFSADLTWTEMHPIVDSVAMTAGDAGSFKDIAHAHLEGTCRVSGSITLPGDERVQFDGVGGRDIAVGPRDWSVMRHYRLAWPIFPDMTFITTRALFDGRKEASLKVAHHEGAWSRVGHVVDSLEFQQDDMTVKHIDWEVEIGGKHFRVRGRPLYRVFIPLGRFMLAEHMAEFVRDDGVVGYGLLECGFRFPWSGNGV